MVTWYTDLRLYIIYFLNTRACLCVARGFSHVPSLKTMPYPYFKNVY